MGKQVVLVDKSGSPVGREKKLKAHRDGSLHLAFSIVIFNRAGEMLLQRRSPEKYHSGGLWTNACCSHPAPGESLEQAAHRRLSSEMGFDCVLEHLFSFVYRVDLDDDLTEYEFDHVFLGTYDGDVRPDCREVVDFK